MTPLNLPEYDIKLRQGQRGSTEVYDPLRRKWLVLTPEEWVRQHFVNYLTSTLGYPASLMANEVSLKLNDTLRRCDTLIYDRYLSPIAIVEYKAPDVVISQRTFDQVARYNMVIGARMLIVSNGRHHYCCRYDAQHGTYRFLPDIPTYDKI